MQHCPACGYASPDGTRFCRQCGEQLLVGSDPLEASTRNYGRVPSAVATPGSSIHLPPSIGDAVQGDTARYPQRPVPGPAAYAPPGRFPMAADTAGLKKKKKRRFLKFAGLVAALLISGGIGAGINEAGHDGSMFVSREDRVRLERLRTEDEIRRELTQSVNEFQENAREEIRNRLESVERAREEAERAQERGDALLSGEKPIDLSPYEYEGSSAGQFNRIPGKEMMTQRTKDDVEQVIRHYQEKMGQPLVRTINDRGMKEVLFQTSTTPPVTVRVREMRDRSRQPEILIIRSPFRFPAPQGATDVAKPKVEEVPKAPVAPVPPAAPAAPEVPKARTVR